MSNRATNTRGRQADGKANPIDIHVGGRVRLRRTILGITQERLGEALGLTFQQVQKYERGTNRMGASRLFDVARVLDVPISFLFDDMPPEVEAASPARITAGTVVQLQVRDAMLTRETLELNRAFATLPDGVRSSVYQLVKQLSAEHAPAPAAAAE